MFTDSLNKSWGADYSCVAFMDLDGTLTDGTVTYDGANISRSFNVQDGHWIDRAYDSEILSIIVTSSKITRDIEQRVHVLGVPILSTYRLYKDNRQMDKSELPVVKDILAGTAITAHIGDDVNDHNLLLAVDFPYITKNSTEGLKNLWKGSLGAMTLPSGGNGAVSTYLHKLIQLTSP